MPARSTAQAGVIALIVGVALALVALHEGSCIAVTRPSWLQAAQAERKVGNGEDCRNELHPAAPPRRTRPGGHPGAAGQAPPHAILEQPSASSAAR
jgi:hypothetical protein